jgi:hypothetical protein
MAMFRLDYLSCLLTVVATVLIGRKMWTGLVLSGVNSLIVCVIGLHTAQYGFIPANMFCICIYVFNVRSWLKVQRDSSASKIDQASRLAADCTQANSSPKQRTRSRKPSVRTGTKTAFANLAPTLTVRAR